MADFENSNVKISVAICTFNRADSLADTLEYLCRQKIDRELQWELLLIDNNCTDHTREVADDVTAEGWDVTMNLNLAAPFFLSQAFVPDMKARRWGRIVNFASLQTTRAFPGGLSYGASKAGVGQLTRAMAEAWSKDGITANAIGPGFSQPNLPDQYSLIQNVQRATQQRPASGAMGHCPIWMARFFSYALTRHPT